MSAPANKLGLRPQERRLIAFVAIVLFVVLNVWLVWPHFGDWGRLKMNQLRANRTLDNYRAAIAKVPSYHVKLRELESAGPNVLLEEQELDLVRTVEAKARMNRLNVIQSDPRPRVTTGSKTNSFFEEQYQNLHVTAGNEELINFLISLTSSDSSIRVKDLTIKPDVGGTRLDSHMTLVASYQRTAPIRTPGATPPRVTNTAAAAPKPAVSRPIVRTNAPSASAVAKNMPTNRVAVPPRLRPTNAPAKKP